MVDAPARHVVLIHGLWVTAGSWSPFRKAWEDAGWTVHTPEWSILTGRSAAEINRDPPPGLGALSIQTIVQEMADYIRALPSPPLLVGHSFGGLFVQILLDRGLGWGGVAINPAPIGGVLPGWLTLTAALKALLRWNGWNRPYAFDRAGWTDRYANAAPAELQSGSFDTWVVPAPGRVFLEAALWIGTCVRPQRRTRPLLITAGDRDRLVTPYLSRAAWRLQRRSSAPTDFILFPGRSHLLIAEPGWEEVAAEAIAWAERAFKVTGNDDLRTLIAPY